MDASSFKREIRRASRPEDRLAAFGALLLAETGEPVEIVGGSAIEIYLGSDAYISQDVDLVASRPAVEAVLLRWGFRRVVGRSQRVYWTEGSVGLVDLVGSIDRSGMSPRELSTRYGPVYLSAREPLIVRRLMRFHREGDPVLFEQAVGLARLGPLDWDYMATEAKFEGVEEELARLRRLSKSGPKSPVRRRHPAVKKGDSGPRRRRP